MSLNVFNLLILPAAPWPYVYSASDRNKYQKIFPGVKSGQSIRLRN
jgi:hypothetical protein